MKKSLVVLFSVLALLVFTAPAFALHGVPEMFEYQPQKVMASKAQITLGGEIRIRGRMTNNLDFDDSDAANDSQEFYDQRVRLNVDAAVSPNTRGFVELEAGPNEDDTYGWGCSPLASSGAKGSYNQGNCKKDTMKIRQAYIAHQGTGLGVLSGVKAGHMLLGLGNGLFFDHTKLGDDALIFWMQPADGTEISFIAAKFDEGMSLIGADDADAYVLSAVSGFSGVNLSGDVTLVHDNLNGPASKTSLWNIGLRGDWTGPVTVMGDVEFQTGSVDNSGMGVGAVDNDFGGWAAMLGVSANVPGPNLSVHGNFAYGSGDDGSDTDFDQFINSLSSGQHYTFVYDQFACTAASGVGACKTNTGLTNTWYLNAGVSVDPTPDLTVGADLYYLAAVEDRLLTGGTDDTDLGFEVDGKVSYQIDTNLVYYVEAGILFAGDFYQNITGTTTVDDPYVIRHGLQLSF